MANHPQLWAGLECTVNRVGDRFQDQVRATGHHERTDDIDRLASIGIATARYPLLWERISPDRSDEQDWGWSDDRLARLKSAGVNVIAGLVHHGGGPAFTHLLDPAFATGVANHAAAVARRYPWISDWTPINEPVTTARFSALYGLWHPHERSEGAFWLALLNQIDATRLAMRAVRRVNPAARLIQTDDLGRTYATAPLREQAGFDNLRRWAGWDLLCGMVAPHHPLFARLAQFGFEDRVRAIGEDPCPPDIIGINHYLTSDRFLDHRLHRYPARAHGGNGRQRYADVEAVRALDPPPGGLEGALREAWSRYGRPLAVTEVHNGCTREEQLRWLAQAWDAACRLRSQQIAVEAVTIWSLFGSQGWNTLLTEQGLYEPGLWDVSGGAPRPTALLPLAGTLARPSSRPPLASGAGWWRRPIRLTHARVARPARISEFPAPMPWPEETHPLLICGVTGTLGQAMARACVLRNIPFMLTGRSDLDLADPNSIERALDRIAPWAVVNAAGWVRVDDAESSPERCFEANSDGAIALVRACAARNVGTLSFSSDLVFDGRKATPYVEDDPVAPLNVYGRSKARMEEGIAAQKGGNLIIRTAAFFSPDDDHNFAIGVVRALEERRRFAAADDLIVTPTYVPHLVSTALDLLIDGEEGLWHLSNEDALSWSAFAVRIAQSVGLDAGMIDSVPHRRLGWPAARPAYAALTTGRGARLPPLSDAIADFARRMETDRMARAA